MRRRKVILPLFDGHKMRLNRNHFSTAQICAAIAISLCTVLSACESDTAKAGWEADLDQARQARRKNDNKEAISLAERALQKMEAEKVPAKDRYHACSLLGACYEALNDLDRAESYEKQSAELAEQNGKLDVAARHYFAAGKDITKKHPVEALAYYADAQRCRETFDASKTSQYLLPIFVAAGEAASECGKYSLAEKDYKQALEIMRAHPPDNQTEPAEINKSMADNYMRTHEYLKAAKCYDHALHLADVCHYDPATVIQWRQVYADCLDNIGRHDEADMWRHKQAQVTPNVKIYNATRSVDKDDVALALPSDLPGLMSSGKQAFDSGNLSVAEQCYKQALEILRSHPGESMAPIEANLALAEVYQRTHRNQQSIELFDRAAHLAEAGVTDGARLKEIRNRYADALDAAGRHSEASMWRNRE